MAIMTLIKKFKTDQSVKFEILIRHKLTTINLVDEMIYKNIATKILTHKICSPSQ